MSRPSADFNSFARAARDFQDKPDEGSQLQLAAELAVEFVPGCDHAGIAIVKGSRTVTGGSSDHVVRRGDELQNELNEGPSLDSVRTHDTVISQDLSREPRWPRWAPQVISELGVRSMLSLLLHTTSRSYGSLNLYADRTQAYNSESLAVAQTLAAHIAVAVAARREIDHRGVAMVNRTVIGQAEGILMERFDLSPDQAFNFLRRQSQQSNRKLLQVCTELVAGRQLKTSGGAGSGRQRRSRSELLVLRALDEPSQLGQQPGQQPGHLHLAGSDLLGDLSLGAALGEPEPQQPSLGAVELGPDVT